MTVDERAVTEALSRLADRARPVDPELLLSRALRRRARMKWPRWGLALAAAACVVAIGVVALRAHEQLSVSPASPPTTSTGPTASTEPTARATATAPPATAYVRDIPGLPRNTIAQFAKVEDCMPKGSPVHSMDGERLLPQYGTVKDYRWLVEAKDKLGVTRLVGSRKGFVLCTPAIRLVSYPTDPVFSYWGGDPPGKPALRGALSVDVYSIETQSEINPGRDGDPSFLVVAGRVAPQATRVEVEWADGRKMTASVRDGFYIGRSRVYADKKGSIRPVLLSKVTAYDSGGQALGELKNVKWRSEGAIDADD
ncbi:hypothetical protein [Nonomuraea aurantiaca]|uniref:hypothetical protein n=1 Tax=Nonomuraea aurantiaca TaxID=2878562 RepID=UPI001CD93616|nr:hypothetical protein [Nonomuraea aurantiaca]MCA2228048.1 hypothetical protein [Nonomuraea aurantiaca]